MATRLSLSLSSGAASRATRSQVPVSCRRADSSTPDPASEPKGIGLFIGAAVPGLEIGPGEQAAASTATAAATAYLKRIEDRRALTCRLTT